MESQGPPVEQPVRAVAEDSSPVEVAIAEDLELAEAATMNETRSDPVVRRPLEPLPDLSIDDVVRTCGNAVFEPDGVYPTNTTELRAELQEIVGGSVLAREGNEWFLLDETEDFLSLFGFDPDGYHGYAFMERQDGAWVPIGFGDCQMRLEIDGVWTLAWWPGEELDATTTSFEIVEESCRGDEIAYGPEHVAAVVVEDPTEVTVLLVAAPVPPAPVSTDVDVESICRGPADPVTLTVELEEPLGDRSVFNGVGELVHLAGA